jgi:hypothetical protein
MWTCSSCGTEVEGFYVACSQCGTARAGTASSPWPKPNLETDRPHRGKKVHRYNQIPLKERAVNLLVSVGVITYGGVGLVIDDLYLPGRRRGGIHLHGGPAIVGFIGLLLAVAVLVATVVDHYDHRDNERHYKEFARISGIASVGFLVVAIVWQAVSGK